MFFLSSCAFLEGLLASLSESSSQNTSSQESYQEMPPLEKDSVENTSSVESFDKGTSIEESSSEEESSVKESSSEESLEEDSSIEEESSVQSSASEEPEEVSPYKYTDFTEWEKKVLLRYIGEVLPFPATDEYGFEGYYEEEDYQNGVNFYTLGNTQADFNAYRRAFLANGYTLDETYMDDAGDTWYCYQKRDIFAELAYYYYDGENWIDVYVYSSLSDGVIDEDLLGGNNNENEDDGEDVGGGTDNVDEPDLMTNAGKGLPNSANGVYNVDFTKASYVKNVTEQGYYLDGCPTTGNPAVLVIPVEFSDARASTKGYSIDKIKTAFTGNNDQTTYCSVYNYYYASSYGKLDLDITVLDSWFMPQYSSSYYERQTMEYYDDEIAIGDQMVLDEALSQLSKSMDLSKFDSDGNGCIDSVVMITTITINSENDFQWAYRYWNLYTDDEGYYYEYDGVSANDYIWASYQFMHEDVDRYGNTVYTNTSIVNPYTYIHEFGHVLGADDYYDTAYVNAPMGGHDVMDGMIGDHNAYTKFHYGWLTSSRLVVAEDTITLTLEDFSKNGDTIIIANNWDESLGVYQEYYVLVYYKNTGLNGGDFGYFADNGIVVYHVNASLYKDVQGDETYYDIYNTNTDPSDPSYGTEDNLIEFVLLAEDTYVYLAGDSLSADTTDDQGNKIAYTFTVDALASDKATITFKKNT